MQQYPKIPKAIITTTTTTTIITTFEDEELATHDEVATAGSVLFSEQQTRSA
jgi:hypothetical protein